MPPVRYYEVEQTRVVNVSAYDEIDAAVIAKAAFDGQPKPDGVFGNTLGAVEVNTLHISKEY